MPNTRKEEANTLARSVVLNARQICDLEMIVEGAFAPLSGFLNADDYDRCVRDMRLANGSFWPMPVTLDVSEDFAKQIRVGESIGLKDSENVVLAILDVESIYRPDRLLEAKLVFGTDSVEHPGVRYLLESTQAIYIGGKLRSVEKVTHFDYAPLRLNPQELRAEIKRRGWTQCVGFQTRNPMHRAHVELIKRSLEERNLNVLVHPVVGLTKPGDIDHYTRVRCYQHVIKEFPEGRAMLSLLNLAMRMGGPREALWHAMIRKNFGCTHFIVGRDHAGPGKDSTGKSFYALHEARELAKSHEPDLGIEILPFEEMFYVESQKKYFMAHEVPPGEALLSISGTQLRDSLDAGTPLPEWFSYPEVIRELQLSRRPRTKQGLVLFFTGLSGSGKSTLSRALLARILEKSHRSVTLLDGDEVRSFLSSELGFSKEHRDLNIRRIGYVASQVAKAGGVAICAPIAPYAATRRSVRRMVEGLGANFLEIHLSTALEICEKRERKGLYAKARAGIIPTFTGISDPYETPETPELRVDTEKLSISEALELIWSRLEDERFF